MAAIEDQATPYPGEVLVPEQTIPAHSIRATATPRAVALMVGMLKLRQPRHGTPCTVTDSGGAAWHLTGGFVVTLDFDEDGSATWHLDTDIDDDQSSERPADTPACGGGDAESHGRQRRG